MAQKPAKHVGPDMPEKNAENALSLNLLSKFTDQIIACVGFTLS